jgi:methyl-accepting chemotaxis protein
MSPIEQEIENIKVIINQLRSVFASHTEELSSSHAVLNSKVASLNASVSNCVSGIEKLFSRLAEIKNDFDNSPATQGKLVSKDVLQAFSDRIDAFKARIEGLVSDAVKPGVQSLGMLEQLRGYHTMLADKLDAQQTKQAQSKAALQELEQTVQEHKRSTSVQMISSIDSLRDDLTKKISSLPVPKPSVSSEEVKKIVSDGLEPVSFDAKNASLRSSNTDMKVSLLEKKVENMMLLAKRFELSK